MNNWTIFQTLAEQIQTPLFATVDTMVASLTGPTGAIIRAGMIVMIAWLMLKASLMGGSTNPLSDLEGKLILGGAVYLLASQVANYHYWVEDLFLHRMSDEVSALVTGGGAQPFSGQAFDEIWNTAFTAGLQVYRNLHWTDVSLGILVVVFWVFALVAIAVGFTIWLASYVILALLIGLGPIFVACFAFPPVRSIGERWIGSLISSVILQVFVVALLAILTKTENAMIGQIATTGSDGMANNIIQLQLLLGGLALFFVCSLVLFQLPGAAAALSSGLSFHAGHVASAGRNMARVAGNAAGGVASGVATGARTLTSGGRSPPGKSLSSS